MVRERLSRGSAGLIFVVVAAEAKVACCGCCVDGDGFMLRAAVACGCCVIGSGGWWRAAMLLYVVVGWMMAR